MVKHTIGFLPLHLLMNEEGLDYRRYFKTALDMHARVTAPDLISSFYGKV